MEDTYYKKCDSEKIIIHNIQNKNKIKKENSVKDNIISHKTQKNKYNYYSNKLLCVNLQRPKSKFSNKCGDVNENEENSSKHRSHKRKSKKKEKVNIVSSKFKIANDFDEKGVEKFLKEKNIHLMEMNLTDDINEARKKEEEERVYTIGDYFLKVSVDSENEEENKKEYYGTISPIKKLRPKKSYSENKSKKSIFSSESEEGKSFSDLISDLK